MDVSGNEKLTQLRELFQDPKVTNGVNGCIDAYLLPATDAHQNEYLSRRDRRIRFLSGFSGSNAYAIVTRDKALLWTDGRYFIQAKNELVSGWELMKEGLPDSVSPTEWIVQNFKRGSRIAFDPQLFKHGDALRLIGTFNHAGITATALKGNLVDAIWIDRPSESVGKVIPLKKELCGMEAVDKVAKVREKLTKHACNVAIFTALDEIAWLLNIRGSDIPYNPLVFSIVFLSPDTLHLFIDKRKLTDEVLEHLSIFELHEYAEAHNFIANWINEYKGEYNICIWDTINHELGSLIKNTGAVDIPSVIQPLKAMKNDVELNGMRQSSIRDSLAIVEFIVWLEDQVESGKSVTEMEAGKKMDEIRSEQSQFVSASFETIAAVDEHAALPHYRATSESGKQLLTRKSVFLIDSGGHYRDGTTDVTRTIAFSDNHDEEFKRMFTLVLKGHIANALLKFPNGVNDGHNFEHGVGHGVGHFLNVHEGPAGITFRRYDKDGGIRKGMIITIEPGFYVENQWGIRIENCYEVVEAKNLRSNASNYLTFAALTLVPIQKTIIDKSLLGNNEIEWINKYHERCFQVIGEKLMEQKKTKTFEWLKKACSPL